MRVLGAQSLKSVCELDLEVLGPKTGARVASHPVKSRLDNFG